MDWVVSEGQYLLPIETMTECVAAAIDGLLESLRPIAAGRRRCFREQADLRLLVACLRLQDQDVEEHVAARH